MRRTFVPYFDWSFDAPTTANRGEERKSFCICATVRVMLICAHVPLAATRLKRVPSTRPGRCLLLLSSSQVSCGGLLGKEPHFSYPSARPLHTTIYLVQYPLLNGNHVLAALAIHCPAPLLWHSHRLLSLLRNYVCHLRVQETYRGQCDGDG